MRCFYWCPEVGSNLSGKFYRNREVGTVLLLRRDGIWLRLTGPMDQCHGERARDVLEDRAPAAVICDGLVGAGHMAYHLPSNKRRRVDCLEWRAM